MSTLQGAVSSPDQGGYVYEDSSLYTWMEISTTKGGSGTRVNWNLHRVGGYSYTDPIALNFSFNYYGTDYDSVYIMSGGWLSFTGQQLKQPSLTPFPNLSDSCRGVIAPLARGFDLDGWGDGCYYQAQGMAPSRKFIVEWSDAVSPDYQDHFTFQVVFYEENQQIRFQYYQLPDTSDSSVPESSHVGIESPDEITGTDCGVQAVYNQAGYPSTGGAYLLGWALVLTAPVNDTAIQHAITITWSAIADSAAARLALYWDHNTDTTGTLITQGLAVEKTGQYTWPVMGFSPADTVRVYGVLTSGTDTTVSYAPGRICFKEGCRLRLTGPAADTLAQDKVTMAWAADCPDSNAGMALYWDHGQDTTGTLITDTLTVGQGSFYTWQPAGFTYHDTVHIYGVLTSGPDTCISYAPGRIYFPLVCTLAFTHPVQDTSISGGITLQWAKDCPSGSSTVSLYWDREKDTTGTLIAQDLRGTSYAWDAIGFTALDTINIYGAVASGIDTTIHYASGQVTFYEVSTGIQDQVRARSLLGPQLLTGPYHWYCLDGRVWSGQQQTRPDPGVYLRAGRENGKPVITKVLMIR